MKESQRTYKTTISKLAYLISDVKSFFVEKYKSSATCEFIERAKLRDRSIKFRRRIVRNVERLHITSLYARLTKKMLEVSTRVYGTFFLTFGLYISLVYLVKRFAFSEMGEELTDLVVSGALIIAALPIFFIDRPLSNLLRTGKLSNYFLYKVLGIREAMLKPCTNNGGGYVTALVLGLIFGSLTIFFSPLDVLAAIVVVVIGMVVFASPESGVTLLFLLLPFLSSELLCAAVLLVIISHSWKVLTLKRTLHFKGGDYAVLGFCALTFIFGQLSLSQPEAMAISVQLMVFAMAYFAVTQLVVNTDIFYCCIRSFLIGSFFISIITILKFFSEIESIPYTKYIVIDFKSEYSIVMLLVVSLPILISRFRFTPAKALNVISILLTVSAIIFSGEGTYWLTALLIFFVSLFVFSKKTFIIALFFFTLGVAAGGFFLPKDMTEAVYSVLKNVVAPFGDVFVTVSVFPDNIFEGLGFGSGSHNFAGVVHNITKLPSPNTLTYIHRVGGIMLVIDYFLLLIGIGVNTVDSCVGNSKKRTTILVRALSCSVLAMLVESLVHNYLDCSVLSLMLWLFLGLISAGNNAAKRETESYSSF